MKKELYNNIMDPGFINKPGEVMKVNSNQYYDVFIISEGNGYDITFCIKNFKYQIMVFEYTLDIRELTYRDINGLFYDINDAINNNCV